MFFDFGQINGTQEVVKNRMGNAVTVAVHVSANRKDNEGVPVRLVSAGQPGAPIIVPHGGTRIDVFSLGNGDSVVVDAAVGATTCSVAVIG